MGVEGGRAVAWWGQSAVNVDQGTPDSDAPKKTPVQLPPVPAAGNFWGGTANLAMSGAAATARAFMRKRSALTQMSTSPLVHLKLFT